MDKHYLHDAVVDGCANGFTGHLCDTIIAYEAMMNMAIEIAMSLSSEAEAVGTIGGNRELLEIVGKFREATKFIHESYTPSRG